MLVSDPFWDAFKATNGLDSTLEHQFLGYLTTQGISPFATPDVLTAALAACQTYLTTSSTSTGVAGPSRVTLTIQQALEEMQATYGTDVFLAQATNDVATIYQ